MRCPVCKGETTREGNPYGPFCSERCKLIDLDNWLSERYRIAVADNTAEAKLEGAAAPKAAEEDRG
jgi:endogenous inhibitor of DNA gyrase (YacG/DUF329 family)